MKGAQHNVFLTKQLCQEYLNQLEVIRIIFFCLRSKGDFFDAQERHDMKKKLKGAQRYLENLKGIRKENRGQGDLVAFESALHHWKKKELECKLYNNILRASEAITNAQNGITKPLPTDFKFDIFTPIHDPSQPKFFIP